MKCGCGELTSERASPEQSTTTPGTECIYVLEGALNLEEGGTSVQLKAGDAHCVPPRTVLVPRNASGTAPYKSLVVMIAPKGQPLAVPVKD
jgi:quercetin dioxygenase-like cupin family protein